MTGTILRVGVKEGVVIRTGSGEREVKLPPDLGLIEKAPPGRYTLRESGLVVEDPDYVAAFSFAAP